MEQAARPLAFYIHIPYCVRRCGYCDFNTYTPEELRTGGSIASVSEGYVDLLLKEIELVPPASEIPSIFIGGGTPTLLEPKDLGRVLKKLQQRFSLASDCEITIEGNPDSVTQDKLMQLREIGVNRISFGMQSANQQVLRTLDRTHKPENVVKAVNWSRQAGFSQVSVDLIYGAPGESMADWISTIDNALSLDISHISAYALIVEEGTKLGALVRRGEVVMPDEDLTADKYLVADEKFTAAGFHWYELSNWAQPNSLCQHNIGYWLGANWWGLGPGAHSHMDGRRWWNVKHPNTYRERLLSEVLPMQEEELLSESEKETERIMLRIRMPRGIHIDTLNKTQKRRLDDFRNAGYFEDSDWRNGWLTLSRPGRLLADKIVREIVL